MDEKIDATTNRPTFLLAFFQYVYWANDLLVCTLDSEEFISIHKFDVERIFYAFVFV